MSSSLFFQSLETLLILSKVLFSLISERLRQQSSILNSFLAFGYHHSSLLDVKSIVFGVSHCLSATRITFSLLILACQNREEELFEESISKPFTEAIKIKCIVGLQMSSLKLACCESNDFGGFMPPCNAQVAFHVVLPEPQWSRRGSFKALKTNLEGEDPSRKTGSEASSKANLC